MLALFKLFLDKHYYHRHGTTAPSPQSPAASRSASPDRSRISTAKYSSSGEERRDGHRLGYNRPAPDCHGGRNALELGQPSRDPPGKEDYYCFICMEEKHSFEFIAMRGCAHAYCAQCVGEYVAAKVEANEVWVGCPEPECGAGRVEPDMCRLILPAELLERWGDRLCEEGIPGPARFYCPYKDCGALLIHDEGGVPGQREVRKSACPHCKRWVCGRCRVVWHRRLTCKRYQELGSEEARAEEQLLVLARSKKWQRCPKCGFLVEKSSGCDGIRCRCKQTFCYKCAGPTGYGSHECPAE